MEIAYPLTIRRVDCVEGTATYYFQQQNGIEEAWFVAPCGVYKVGEVMLVANPVHISLDSIYRRDLLWVDSTN